jgi:hypothetical protein
VDADHASGKIALAAEPGVLRGHTVTQNLTFIATKRMEESRHDEGTGPEKA